MIDRGDTDRGTCRDCGGKCGRWTRSRATKRPVRCADCRRAVEDVQRSLAEGLWAQGLPWLEIQSILGCSNGVLSMWRARGVDLPYRYNMRNGVRIP
jgi:hypothetical protein